MPDQPFHHPYDRPLSSGLRFLTELIAWVAGPWLVWTPLWASIASTIVVLTIIAGVPRMLWLLRGARIQ